MKLGSLLLVFLLPAAEKPKNASTSLKALLAHLEIGTGSVVADVGAGGGGDTWTFAEIVGPEGRVYSEEIEKNKVESLAKKAAEKGYKQVEATLGRDDDPCLPENSVDLIFTKRVYHHFSKPRAMLRGMWRALKPGGYLVVVDQRRGTLRDWIPRERRSKGHFWIAETTVVREAREEGFAFVRCAEEFWHEQAPFVLVFQRPTDADRPSRHPDSFLPLDLERATEAVLPVGQPYTSPLFIALGESRKLLPPLLEATSDGGREIVLEEWATYREERPPLAEGTSIPAKLTDDGDPRLGVEPTDVAFFLDTYHLLFHAKTLLRGLRRSLAPTGCVYVLDRRSEESEERRVASHRRKINPDDVVRELEEAGFYLWFRGPQVAADRFLLVFGKTPDGLLSPAIDPFVAGPEIPELPDRWYRANRWRLRGLRTLDGRSLPLPPSRREGDLRPLKAAPASAEGQLAFEMEGQGCTLLFQKKGEVFQFVDFSAPEEAPNAPAEKAEAVVHGQPQETLVPVYRYRGNNAIGKVAFYSEYGAQNDEPGQYGGSLAAWRDNCEVITEYSTFFPITLRSAHEPEKFEWAIDLAVQAFEKKQLIAFFGYGRRGVDNLSRVLDRLEAMRNGEAIIRAVFANKLADEPYLGGKSTKEAEELIVYFDEKIQSRYPHIQSWINFAVSTDSIKTWGSGADGRKRLPSGLDIVSIDWYAYLGNGKRDNWGHRDFRVAEKQVLEFMERFLDEQTHKLKEAIGAAYPHEDQPMMLLLGNSSYVYGITHPTPVSIQDAYFEYVKNSEWAGLMWWIFEDYKDSIGGRHHEILRSHQRHGERIRKEKLY